jgi:hypothetical protein
MSELTISPESKGVQLKKDLDRLFSPEFANVQELSEWTIFLYRDITRLYQVKDVPKAAGSAATQDLAPKTLTGYPFILFDRQQHAVRFLGVEKVIRDEVGFSVSFSNHANDMETVYATYVDMTKQAVPYDERLANVVRICLEQASDSPQE